MAAQVSLKDAHHTISVAREVWDLNGLNLESRTTESVLPINDSLLSGAAWINAQAEANLLRISAFAAADYPNHDSSSASARSEFSFSPEMDTVAPITIDVTGWDHWYFSLGYVTLFDITSGATLWDYNWDGPSGTLPWVDHAGEEPRGTANLTLGTELLEAHDYRLTMFTSVGSQEPSSPHILVQVSGLIVPEPSAFALIALAGTGLVFARRRQH